MTHRTCTVMWLCRPHPTSHTLSLVFSWKYRVTSRRRSLFLQQLPHSFVSITCLISLFPNKFSKEDIAKKKTGKKWQCYSSKTVGSRQWKTCDGIKNEVEEWYFCMCRICTRVFGVLRGNSLSDKSHSTHKHVRREHTHYHTHIISSNSELMCCQGWTFCLFFL